MYVVPGKRKVLELAVESFCNSIGGEYEKDSRNGRLICKLKSGVEVNTHILCKDELQVLEISAESSGNRKGYLCFVVSDKSSIKLLRPPTEYPGVEFILLDRCKEVVINKDHRVERTISFEIDESEDEVNIDIVYD